MAASLNGKTIAYVEARMRSEMGSLIQRNGHLMWSTDFPHSGSDWPESRVTAERVFRGVPKDEVKKMLHDNCKRLYKLDYIPDTLADL